MKALVNTEPAGDKIQLSPVFGAAEQPVQITYPEGTSEAVVTIGGVAVERPAPSAAVPEGVLPTSVVATIDGASVTTFGTIVRGGEQRSMASRGLTIVEPDDRVIATVLSPLLPRFSFALNDSRTRIAIAPSLGVMDFETVANAAMAQLDGQLVSEAMPFTFQLQSSGLDSGVELTLLELVMQTEGTDGVGSSLTLLARLRLADVVNGLIVLAGFDEDGAWETLADFLDFDPAMPPESIPVEMSILLADQ